MERCTGKHETLVRRLLRCEYSIIENKYFLMSELSLLFKCQKSSKTMGIDRRLRHLNGHAAMTGT